MEGPLFDWGGENAGLEVPPVVIAPPKLDTLKLYPHQEEAVEGLRDVACQAWREGCNPGRAYRLR